MNVNASKNTSKRSGGGWSGNGYMCLIIYLPLTLSLKGLDGLKLQRKFCILFQFVFPARPWKPWDSVWLGLKQVSLGEQGYLHSTVIMSLMLRNFDTVKANVEDHLCFCMKMIEHCSVFWTSVSYSGILQVSYFTDALLTWEETDLGL